MDIVHLFDVGDLGSGAEEDFEMLLQRPGLRLERIVSRGHASDWFDQDWDEWVAVLAGAAVVEIEGRGEYRMGAGDAMLLPAHVRHRVAWTDPDGPTVWLAIHFV